MQQRDAIVVGARCAGSTLATALARRGWDVVLVDRATFPSDVLSTHLTFPYTLARFERLGVLDALRAEHELPLLEFRIIGLGHESGGGFDGVDGFDRCAAPRRLALDKAVVDTALAAGAEARFGERVVELIGAGTGEDPVAGVVLEGGERIGARWVFGADGRASTVAARLGVEKTRPLSGGVSFLLGYWRGIANDGWATTDIREDRVLSRWAGEDGTHLITAWGDAEFSKGSKQERRARYFETLSRFAETLDPSDVERGELLGDVLAAPESLMRGYFRTPAGPGWALLGDACHFKHPATAQGIGDAVEQALYIADALGGPEPSSSAGAATPRGASPAGPRSDAGLAGYEEWRDRRAREHYEWSYSWGRLPPPGAEIMFRGFAAEPEAAQDYRESLNRRVEPSQVVTKERMERWAAVPAAEP